MNRSILIVDDDFDQLELLTRRFIRSGYQVHSVDDPLQALEAARLRTFLVAIIDATLPDMDGLELMHRLKRIQDGVQVVILSSSNQAAWQAKADGAFACLGKPCNLEQLENTVEDALERALLELAERGHEAASAQVSVST